MAVAYASTQRVVYYHHSTSNKSFIDMALYLKDKGVQHYEFMLLLLDADLAGVDPHNPNLPTALKSKVLREVIYNPWYFLREVVRIPTDGAPKGIAFILHRGNLAMLFCLMLNINTMCILPRQTGKTYCAVVWYLYLFNFGTSGAEISFLNKKFEDSKNNLLRMKTTRDLLPSYLQMNAMFAPDGSKLKGRNSVETMEHPINGNKIRTVPSARDKTSAASLMRGRTTSIVYIDEYAFIKHNKIIYMNMVPAWNTAAHNAKNNHRPYGMLITTTPGMLATEEGQYCYDVMGNATQFSEQWYNLTYAEIMDIVATNERSTFVFIQFTYQQLGYSEAWFRQLCKDMELNWDDIRREVLLEWSPSIENSPFRKEDLDMIRNLLKAPIGSFMIFNKYTILVYERMDPRHVPILGVDVAGGYSHDSSAITIVDSWTTKVTAEFNCNWIPTLDLAAVIQEIVSKYMPNAVVNIERNGGFGATVIAALLRTNIKRNLFFSFKDRVIEERYGGHEVVRKKQLTKVYGSDSTHEERDKLIEILRSRVNFHKDKIISKTIYDELCGMEVKKNGRVEHSSNTHDDQVFSWLWALYVIYEGGDLMRNWGIERHEIRTDADLEEAVYDFEQGKEQVNLNMTGVDLETQQIVDEQMKTLENSPGKKMYREWLEEEKAKDAACLAKLLKDPKAREAYARDMHLTLDDVTPAAGSLDTLPMDVFLNGDPTETQIDQGNLSSMFSRISRVFGR